VIQDEEFFVDYQAALEADAGRRVLLTRRPFFWSFQKSFDGAPPAG
jgi:hypothetical protein